VSVVSQDKSPIEQVLDLAFFAPLGLALSAKEALPVWVGKGRHRVEHQVHVATMVGEHAARHGQKVVTKTLVGLGILPGPPPPTRTRPAPSDVAPASDPGSTSGAPSANGRPSPPSASAPSAQSAVDDAGPVDHRPGPGSPELAIPGYDSLSAFQVVQRLAGLEVEELEAVRSYEAAGRGRRTILTKISQLQTGRS
jgi:hypothetical protein